MATKEDQYIGTDPILRKYAQKGHQLEFFFVPSGGSSNPLTVKFMAFLTQLEDAYVSDWTKDRVYGRMDPIATFQGTVRTISIGWSVPSFSGEEAQNNLLKMSKLISMCYPVYGGQETSTRGASQISGAPLIKLKFANLITGMSSAKQGTVTSAAQNGLLGWIDGISFSPNLEAGFFDPSPGALFPKQLDLSCQFNALHEHALGWSRSLPKKSENETDANNSADSGIRKQEGTKNFPYGSSFEAGGKYASATTEKPKVAPPAPTAPALQSDVDAQGQPTVTDGNTGLDRSPAAATQSVIEGEILNY